MHFADKLQASIDRAQSFVVAGFDPRLETFPRFILNEAQANSQTSEEALYQALTVFHSLALEALAPSIAAIKPNLAFFESYGIGGMRAFAAICRIAKEYNLPIITDGKRSDIGSTAKAYSAAYLGRSQIFGKAEAVFDTDALTVNPFLGFDTLEVFLEDCRTYGKGIFVLVKTSNPGSADIQNVKDAEGLAINQRIAEWAAKHAKELEGACGYSGLGVVAGATYPEEARALRSIMPTNLFLIPGMGAQGGTAQDAVAGFSARKGGAVINLSRGLLSSFSSLEINKMQMMAELKQKIAKANAEITQSLVG